MGSPRGKNRKAAPSKPVTTEAPASNSGPAYINPQLWPLCRPIAWFKPDPENARLHPPENLAATAASLRRFKQQKNVVALEDGTVVAGNGTLEAAKGLGWEQLAAVTFASLDEAVAYAVADNRSAELAVWGPKLQASMDRIAALKIDLADVGFVDADALRKIMVAAHTRAPVESPEEFAVVDESISIDHKCPKCGYAWSGGKPA